MTDDKQIFNNVYYLKKQCSLIKFLNIKFFKNKTDPALQKKIKKEIMIQNKNLIKMKEKYQLSLEVIEKDEEDNLFDKIEKVFITFNSMEAKDLVQNELCKADGSQSKELKKLQLKRKAMNIKRRSQKLRQSNFASTQVKNSIQANLFKGLEGNLKHFVIEEKQRQSAHIKSKSTVDPEFIKWKSSGYSILERNIRKLFTGIVFIFIILVSSYTTVKFN